MSEPRVVWADPDDMADVKEGLYATIYGSPTHPMLVEVMDDLGYIYGVATTPDAYLLVGPVNEDGSVQVGDERLSRDTAADELAHFCATLLDAASRVSNTGGEDE